MTKIANATQLASFLEVKEFAVVHFDAEWDVGYRPIVCRKLRVAERFFVKQVNFGEVNCDQSWDLARSINVPNVPLVAYYRQCKLIAALVGHRQNVQLRIERLLKYETTCRDWAASDAKLNFWPYGEN